MDAVKIYLLTAGSGAPEAYRHRTFAYDNLAEAKSDLYAWGRELYGEAGLPDQTYHLGTAVERVGEIEVAEWVGRPFA